ncbi:NAD-dependent epimerase/dehydratase family protein [Brevibacillus laterosporus]|uniref:NAD-dependent epimerase/dehydratase family protein n=1 Tax=Brevibacillus laterosporus TaxID=1465 RepID=UPI0014443ABD|nr:NAD(P)-dependent oxidoreductase [Brevibacillus laterosporus]NKQ21061.1 NAD(P)-dependent oxidoreductase [Brevibacillus laterosporus]WNX31569.1 NAD(P)-dependent oxidoreductase [Brevibacillus laterosporus]
MEKVLVTGGNGWIGRYVVSMLHQMGCEVHAMYRRAPLLDITCTWHQVDLLCHTEVADLIDKVKPSHLVHLAWEAVPPHCYHSLVNYYWVQSSMALFRHFVECGGKRAVVAGTCAEYEWVEGYLSETASISSYKTPYSVCKNTLRLWLQSYSEQVGLCTCWGRIFHLYGPHDPGNRLVSTLITSLLKGEEALCTHGNQYRDFLYITDVADALVSLLRSDIQGTVNIASGQPIQLKQIASLIGEKIGNEELIKWGAIPSPQDEPLFVGANIERLQRGINWKPKYSLDAGLEETIVWWKNSLDKHSSL